MSGMLKEKKYDSWKSLKMIYEHDTAITNGQVHHEVSTSKFTWSIYRNTFTN